MPQIQVFALQPASPEIADCARWRAEAFSHVLERTAQAEQDSLEAFISDQSDQVALVASRDGIPAGTCLLVRSEPEPVHPVSPWLAGLYVVPSHRRHGIGQALVRAIEEQARQRGHRRLYLYTHHAAAYYRRLGWTATDQVDWKGSPTTLMVRDLTP